VAEYRFTTTWTFAAPVDRVWPEVGDPLNWKTYWAGLEDVRPAAPGARPAPGAVYDLTFKSFLPYTLTLTARLDEYDPPHRMIFSTTGELRGVAEFVLDDVDGRTRTQLVWTTRTTKSWMNALAFLLRPLFEWNHDFLMRRAGTGLAARIGAQVTHAEGSAPSFARALVPLGVVVLTIVVFLGRSRR
jgi:uncharacterized protein YndB with AHSA1/START domain